MSKNASKKILLQFQWIRSVFFAEVEAHVRKFWDPGKKRLAMVVILIMQVLVVVDQFVTENLNEQAFAFVSRSHEQRRFEIKPSSRVVGMTTTTPPDVDITDLS